MCMKINAPPARSAVAEGRDMLNAQVELAPKMYEQEALYGPKYADLETQNFLRSLGTALPGVLDAQRQATSSQRGADAEAIEKYGGRVTSAIKGANPDQQALMQELNRQAMEELGLGATLDPSLRREVQQSVRAGQSARGMGLGPNDLADEALFTGLRAEQLRQSRRGFGMQVAGMNQATAVDPLMAILGRPSMVNGSLLNQGVGAGKGAGPGMFDPFNAYGSDLYNTNYNAKAAAQIATGNANAALIGSGIEAAGSLLGGAMMCWVAREVYGTSMRGNLPNWILFREWVQDWSPRWFMKAYLKHGPAIAEWLSDKPRVKAIVRKWMDARIDGLIGRKFMRTREWANV